MMAKRTPAEHRIQVQALCCIVCRNQQLASDSPAEIRFIDRRAEGRHATPYEIIPLCWVHHRAGDGGPKYQGQVAVRRNLHVFERLYGSEKELLAQTLIELEIP